MGTGRYIGKLARDFAGFAWKNKAWWILPVVLVLLLLAVLIVATQGASSAFIYSLF